MKNKILSFIFVFTIIFLPNMVMAYENIDLVQIDNYEYQLFDNGTAKLKSITEKDNVDVYTINSFIQYNGETYIITEYANTIFSKFTKKQNIYISSDKPPKLENGISFENIIYIGVKTYSTEYSAINLWPEEKIIEMRVMKEPQDLIVTAGDIQETDILSTAVEVNSYGGVGGSIEYTWQQCDENGNVLVNDLGNAFDFQIPTDLTYDHINNTSKEYYYICKIGFNGQTLVKTRIAKVTVNPGTYKVFFNSGNIAKWTIPSVNGNIIVPVNDERRLTANDVPDHNLLEIGKGIVFAGWRTDDGVIVDPLSIVFDKNVTLYPTWSIKICFDANGGKFPDGSKIFETYVLDTEVDFLKIPENPTREGFEFTGFYSEKNGGIAFSELYANSMFNEIIVVYANWKEILVQNNNTVINEQNNEVQNMIMNQIQEQNNLEGIRNPQTGDNIALFIGLIILSVIGIFIIIKIKKGKKKY